MLGIPPYWNDLDWYGNPGNFGNFGNLGDSTTPHDQNDFLAEFLPAGAGNSRRSMSSQNQAGRSSSSSASMPSQNMTGPSSSSGASMRPQNFAGSGSSSNIAMLPQGLVDPNNFSSAFMPSQDFPALGDSSGLFMTPQQHAGFYMSASDSASPQGYAGPSNSSSSFNAASSSPNALESTIASSPNFEPQPANQPAGHTFSAPAQGVYNSLSDSQRKSVGWAPELDRMFTMHPNFIPTFDFKSAMTMTGRDVVNPVSAPISASVIFDHPDLVEFRDQFRFGPDTTIEQLANLGQEILDRIAQHPHLAEVLKQYSYQPEVEPETIEEILPKVAKTLNEKPELLDYYQVPLWPGQKSIPGDEDENPEPVVHDSDEDADDEDDEPASAKKKNQKKGPKPLESKYRPRAVQYRPYQYRFKTAEEARAHRKKARHPAKAARDVDRVEKYGRYYWTKRIYESMINVDLIFDNRASIIATNFSKVKHFKEDDLEATAHHIFDSCIKVHRQGWCGYDYNRKAFKRGKGKDVFVDSIEKRLERICGILKHSKAIANDCITGGDVLQQTVDNPIYRATTKTANNKGNLDRADRLAKQETDLQREKRLKKEAEMAAKKAEQERKKAERDAKKLETEAKKAEREAEKKRKQEEKAAAQAAAQQAKAAAAAARGRR